MEKPSLDKAKAGAMRFNTDSSQMEIYDGNQWTGILSTSGELQTGGTRGFFAGGNSTNIEFITVDTTGDATDFGDLTTTFWINKCSASRVRGLIHGDRPATTNIDFITIAQKGNAQDFGDLTVSREDCAGVLNGTRAVLCGGGKNAHGNTIDYVTIAQTGNAIDFGDLYLSTLHHGTGESKTRGVIASGYTPSATNVIQFITTSTLGNSSDFGDATAPGYGVSGCSNAVTMIFNTAYNGSSHNTTMNSLKIPTLGDAVFFGDLTRTMYGPGTASSRTRGVFAGDYPSSSDVINYFQFSSLGDGIDFGDLVSGRGHWGGSSNGHGGL